ncbi:MAG: error-prone DNA polymerase [Stellaceae bacterium]
MTKFRGSGATHAEAVTETPAYAELQVTTNFSFLRGASHPAELVLTAAALGHRAIAVTDHNSVAGIVRAHQAAKEVGIRLVVGCRLDLDDGISLLAFPQDRAAYGRLTRLLTSGKRRASKGECRLDYADVIASGTDQIVIVLPPPIPSPTCGGGLGWGSDAAEFAAFAARISTDFRGRAYLAAHHLYRGDDARHLTHLAALSEMAGLPLVATNDVLYHLPERRQLQDVLTCIREGCTIEEAGFRLAANAERHLKSPQEMARLFRLYPEAVARSLEIVERCTFSLDELRYEYPDETAEDGRTPQQRLADLAWAGAAERFSDRPSSSPTAIEPSPPTEGDVAGREREGKTGSAAKYGGIPEKIRRLIEHELQLIERLDYARYFLTVHDIVEFARRRGILCQGRGSAANSVVCYCLGITAVDPARIDVLFERFISAARNEPPDIDVDFEHERREEVIQYIYEKYGRDRAGLAATVICYRSRSAIREVGKALGLSVDVVAALAGIVWGWSNDPIADIKVREAGLDPGDRTLRLALDLAAELTGFPRHLSQHVGGFVITRGPLSELVPIENAAMEDRTVIEWDKDDLDALGILKIDVLALGMLTCIRKSFDLLDKHYGRHLELATVPAEDPEVYEMLSQADSLGVFQVESRAQMTMLPRLKPREFYDLVIEVAIVRPGPIQGDMVHPYLRRRSGREPVEYPSEALCQVLGKTLGVPLFQEQAMKIAIVGAGFAPEEADRLRRAMATFKRNGDIHLFRDKFIAGMVENGYDRDFATRCFSQIEGFGTYGFPESHAASFALLVYVSAWIKCFYPEVFACALLNSQPMGFYAPAQIVRDAREHGVEVRPADVNHSLWDCTLEPIEVTATHAVVTPANAGIQSLPLTGTGGRATVAGILDSRFRRNDEQNFATSIASSSRRKSGSTSAVDTGFRRYDKREIAVTRSNEHHASRHYALRLGFRQIKGFSEADAERLVATRGSGFPDPAALWRRSRLGHAALERLAEADAFRSVGLDRRRALWALKALGDPPPPLFAAHADDAPRTPTLSPQWGARGTNRVEETHASALSARSTTPDKEPSRPTGGRGQGEGGARQQSVLLEASSPLPTPPPRAERGITTGKTEDSETRAAALLPAMPLGEHVVEDYATTGLSLKRHPLAFLRAELASEGLVTAADLAHLPVERRLGIAGVVLIRQRPGSANGVVFITIEDETGIANLIVWPAILERFRRAALGATLLRCTGKLQREESVIHVVAERLDDLTQRLNSLRNRTGDESPQSSAKPPFAVPVKAPGYDIRDIVIPSRNFR